MKSRQAVVECAGAHGKERYVTWKCGKCGTVGSTAEEVFKDGEEHEC